MCYTWPLRTDYLCKLCSNPVKDFTITVVVECYTQQHGDDQHTEMIGVVPLQNIEGICRQNIHPDDFVPDINREEEDVEYLPALNWCHNSACIAEREVHY